MPLPEEKLRFLKADFTSLLGQIPSDTLPAWGKMSLQQMIEHFADAVKVASGKIAITQLITPAENLPKMHAFLMSDTPFKENIANPLMPEVPAPVRSKSIDTAIADLKKELYFFFTVFEKKGQQQTRNPFFGDLNFEENVQLLYKHALHHLRQFGLSVS